MAKGLGSLQTSGRKRKRGVRKAKTVNSNLLKDKQLEEVCAQNLKTT